jgi:hypothetical protein
VNLVTRYNLLLIYMTMLFTAGCGGQSTICVPVSGTVVTKAGKPCDGALVVFHPTAEGQINGPKPVGTTDENGKFILTTEVLNDGARVGHYGVTIVWNKPSKEASFSLSSEGGGGGADQLAGRYGDPSNPKLFADVVDGESDLRFEVE